VLVTDLAKGNVAMALFLVVSTNLLGVFIVPFFVAAIFSIFNGDASSSTDPAVDVKVDPAPLILSLIFTVLIPLTVGLIIKLNVPPAVRFVKRHSNQFKFTSSLALAIVPWMKISESASSFVGLSGGDIVGMLFSVIGMHLLLLLMTYVLARYVMRFELSFVKAITFAGAQKSLPISFSVLEGIPVSALGNPGLVALPIILAQLFQTIFDSFLATKWADWTRVHDASPPTTQAASEEGADDKPEYPKDPEEVEDQVEDVVSKD